VGWSGVKNFEEYFEKFELENTLKHPFNRV
jgi:hypothetical protein